MRLGARNVHMIENDDNARRSRITVPLMPSVIGESSRFSCLVTLLFLSYLHIWQVGIYYYIYELKKQAIH